MGQNALLVRELSKVTDEVGNANSITRGLGRVSWANALLGGSQRLLALFLLLLAIHLLKNTISVRLLKFFQENSF